MFKVINREKRKVTIIVLFCVRILLLITLILTIDKNNAQSAILIRGIENNGQMTHLLTSKLPEELNIQNTAYSYFSIQKIESNQTSSQNTNHPDTSFTDLRDGRIYRAVRIDNQLWMAENLNYNIIDNRHPRKRINFCYEGKNENCEIYGRLYSWETALKVCPLGWHLPTDEEWATLINYLGGRNIAGGKMKETGTTHWYFPNLEATNESGFTAIPGGAYISFDKYEGIFSDIGLSGSWWSSTESERFKAWSRHLTFNFGIINRINSNKYDYFSVRCVKD